MASSILSRSPLGHRENDPTPRSESDAKGILPIEGLGLGPLPQILKMVKFIYSKEKTCVWEA
jgi:hypothetical protein